MIFIVKGAYKLYHKVAILFIADYLQDLIKISNYIVECTIHSSC